MIFLIGSIVFTSWLTLSFKVVERLRIPTFQAIVFNYFSCIITGFIINRHFPVSKNSITEDWFPWAVLMGFTFLVLFNFIAFTAQKLGVAIASVANKLSLVIPFLFSLYLYQEKATALKIAGVVVALLAVVLTCMPSHHKEPSGKTYRPILLFFPVFLFIGSGLLDTMIKYIEQAFLNDQNNNEFLISVFMVAAILGAVILSVLFITGKEKFDYRAILAGVFIGAPNYISIWFLMKVLKSYPGNSSAIIPINNMGIVLFSTLVAWLLFKEHLSKTNWAGIILSLAAIALIAYG